MTNKLPPIDAEDQAWLSDNPNTSDLVEYVRKYGQQCREAALDEAAERCKAADLKSESEGVRLTLTAANHIIISLK